MPITKSGKDNAPAWCGLSYFEVVTLTKDETRNFVRRRKREKMIVGVGTCEIRFGDEVVAADVGSNVDLAAVDDHFEVRAVDGPVTVVWMCGDWKKETSSGIFTVGQSDGRDDKGDAVNYPKESLGQKVCKRLRRRSSSFARWVIHFRNAHWRTRQP